MAQFLTTNAISYQIEQVITTARGQLHLISPYLKLSKTLNERLQDASARGVAMDVVYGKSELKAEELTALAGLKGLKLHFLKNLHAKCYANADIMVIGSLNMYEYSEKNNREMGVLLTRVDDPEAFKAAEEEIKSILRAAELQRTSTRNPEANGHRASTPARTNRRSRPSSGTCIRCSTEVRLNPERPLCGDCYRTWAQWEDYGYPENFCHTCGEEADTSMLKPLCYSCYKQQPNRVLTM